MNDCVGWTRYMRAFIAGKVEVGCERIEDLAAAEVKTKSQCMSHKHFVQSQLTCP